MLKCTFLTFVPVLLWLTCSNGRMVTLSHGAWKGVVGYIPVDRQAVQEKLDIYNAHQGSCGGPLLYLPSSPVFPEILNKSQHVVYIDFGTVTVYNSDVFNPDDSNLYPFLARPESILSIPLLSNEPNGPPSFSLVLDIFYPRNHSNVPNINIVSHYVPVDEVLIDMNEAVVRDGNEEIRLYIDRHDNPCQPATPLIRHELEVFLEDELQLGMSQPDFSACEFLQENYFCSVADSFRDDVMFFTPNICLSAWGPPTNAPCQVSLEVLKITPGFRKRLLLGNNNSIYFLASETYDQFFDATVKFPCVCDVRNN